MHVVVASHQQLPAKGYGGPQRVVVALVRGLAAHGHRVTLLAPPGTRVPEAKLVEVPPRKFNDPTSLVPRSEEHTSELQSLAYLVCRLLLEKKKNNCIVDLFNQTKSSTHTENKHDHCADSTD